MYVVKQVHCIQFITGKQTDTLYTGEQTGTFDNETVVCCLKNKKLGYF